MSEESEELLSNANLAMYLMQLHQKYHELIIEKQKEFVSQGAILACTKGKILTKLDAHSATDISAVGSGRPILGCNACKNYENVHSFFSCRTTDKESAGLPKRDKMADGYYKCIPLVDGEWKQDNDKTPIILNRTSGTESYALKKNAVLTCRYKGTIGIVEPGDNNKGSGKGRELTFPDEVKGKLNGVDKTLLPNSSWFSFQATESGVALDSDNRYKIVLGPKILDPSYPDNGKLWTDDFGVDKLNVPIDVVLKHETDSAAPEKILKCVAVGLRAHTYNLHPDKTPGQEHKLFNYNKNITASFEVENGLLQTGIAYPNSYNGKQDKEHDGSIAVEHINGSPVEFYGSSMGFNGNDYQLVKIIVLDE